MLSTLRVGTSVRLSLCPLCLVWRLVLSYRSSLTTEEKPQAIVQQMGSFSELECAALGAVDFLFLKV